MKSYWFLFWAYNVVWIGIAGYVAFLLVRLGQVGKRLERLERRMGMDPAAPQSSSEA